MFDPDTTIVLYWPGHKKGVGEPLVMGWVTQVLVDNGIKAVFQQHERIARFAPLACPVLDLRRLPKKYQKHRWLYNGKTDSTPIQVQYLNHYSELFETDLIVYKNYVPVKFYETPEVRQVDVVINTRTGNYTPYKRWPYFKELFKMFKNHCITWMNIDHDWRETYGIRGLNYVKKAKLYLGLDTGMSHYVSQFANGKALIINSGFTPSFEFWAWPYDYEYIEVKDLPCKGCLINKHDIKQGTVCSYGHRCMYEIKPQQVFEKVVSML